MIKLHGFGTRDRFPGEKVKLTAKQKSVIDWKNRGKERKDGGTNGAGFSRDGF